MKNILFILLLLKVVEVSSQTVNDTISSANKNTTYTDAVFDSPPDTNPFNFSILSPGYVNTYTGRADISVPLYTIRFGGMDFPLSLVYNAEGIKVDQYAGEVGLGWSLSSMGEIVKEVNGNYEDNEGRDNFRAYLRMLPTSQSTDFPDYYNVISPNLSGKFFIDRDFLVRELEGFSTANISFSRAKSPDSEIFKYGLVSKRSKEPGCSIGPHGTYVSYYPLKTVIGTCVTAMNPENNLDTQSVKIIKDKLTYQFSELEHIVISTKTKDVYYRGSVGIPEPGQSTSVMEYHSGLKLSNITDNLSKSVLEVSYLPLARMDATLKLDKVWDKLIHRVDNGSPTYFFRTMKEFDVSTKENYIKKLVSKIKTQEVEILFTYENIREDKITQNLVLSEIPNAPDVEYTGLGDPGLVNPMVKEPLLKSMVVKNNLGQIIMQYQFVYDYFSSGCSGSLCKRLKLVALEKGYGENNTNKEVYKFAYFDDSNLPAVTSPVKDVFGFRSDVSEALAKDSYGFPVRPNLYKYTETRNTINFSYFSPLKVPALNPVTVAGSYDQGISGLENIRTWSLKSITYPTQGVQSFTYEPHEFTWKGSVIKGGGLRIKEIKMLDPVTNKNLITKYSYEPGQTSSLPTVTGEHDIASSYPEPIRESIPQSYNPLLRTSKGSYVVYPTSKVTDPDGGYTAFTYSSFTNYPEVIKYSWPLGGINTDINLDQYLFSKNSTNSKSFNSDYLRGNILKRDLYDKTGQLLKTTDFQYLTTEYPFPIIPEPFYYPKLRFLYYPVSSTYADNFPVLNPYQSSMLIKRNNLVKQTDTDFYQGTSFKKEVSRNYTERFNLIKSSTAIGPGVNEAIINTYAFEQSITGLSTLPEYEQLQLETVKKTDNEEVLKNKNNLAPAASMMLPESAQNYNFETGSWVKDVVYDLYDDKGNLLQATEKGQPNVILWGYKQTRPIAKIEGATYKEVMQAFGLDPVSSTSYLNLDIVKKSDLDTDATSENTLMTALLSFKDKPELKKFQVTTYAYDPLIGIKAMVSPQGMKTSYVYDSSNRLQKVLDNDSKLISEYKYNYSAVRYYNSEKSKVFNKYCGSSAVGSAHLYTVPENTYSSLNSQAEADTMAENDLNTNGPNYANSVGTCTTISCDIVKGSSPLNSWHYGTLSLYPESNSSFRIKVQYNFQAAMDWNNNGVIVGKIQGNCQSTNIRTSACYSSGVWGITVDTTGNIRVKFVPGATFSLPPDNTVILLDFALPIN